MFVLTLRWIFGVFWTIGKNSKFMGKFSFKILETPPLLPIFLSLENFHEISLGLCFIMFIVTLGWIFGVFKEIMKGFNSHHEMKQSGVVTSSVISVVILTKDKQINLSQKLH